MFTKKQSRNSFPTEGATRETELLEIIHSDVCVPRKGRSLGGNAYIVTFKDDIYMSQPEGYIQEGKEDVICKLNKSLYGLKQASRCWYDALDKFLNTLSTSNVQQI